MAGTAIKALAVAALVCLVFDNARSTTTADDGHAAPETARQTPDAAYGVAGGRGGTAEDRLERTRGRALAAARKAVDETVHKLASTVDGIRRTVAGDDADDGGDRRVSDALDGLLRAVGAEGRAAFEYASDVINETADRAKAAVDRAQRQKQKPAARSATAV